MNTENRVPIKHAVTLEILSWGDISRMDELMSHLRTKYRDPYYHELENYITVFDK